MISKPHNYSKRIGSFLAFTCKWHRHSMHVLKKDCLIIIRMNNELYGVRRPLIARINRIKHDKRKDRSKCPSSGILGGLHRFNNAVKVKIYLYFMIHLITKSSICIGWGEILQILGDMKYWFCVKINKYLLDLLFYCMWL